MPIWIIVLIVVFLVIDIAIMIWIFVKRRGRAFSQEQQTYIRSHWIRIIDSFDSHTREAILDADKLLDYALLRQGFEGSLGDKLKKSGYRFSDLNGLWEAHRLRNRIAHELGDKLDLREAKEALAQFKKALNDLGAKL